MTQVLSRIMERLSKAGRLLILTHARPDGDGLGSIVALARAARAAGRKADLLVPDAVPRRYAFLFAGEAVAGAEKFAPLADAADATVILDTCAFSQLGALEEAVRARKDKIIVVDHHATSDPVGALQWIDTSAAAAGVLTADLIEALGWPVDLTTAEALTVAVASDTGWLRFANTDGRCLRAVAAWLEMGVRPDTLYIRLFQSDRPERIRLMTRMLESLELHCGGALAVMVLRRGDFQQTGALSEETENLVNEALRIGCVETAVLLVENGDGVRASLRSRDRVNVAEVAKQFGGGGHARAAGFRAKEDIDALRRKVIDAIASTGLRGK